MRKKSSYKPRPVRRDTLSYVVSGFQPLTVNAKDEVMRLRVINHGSLERLVHGKGTRRDCIDLAHAFTTTASLAEIGTGKDWLEEITAAETAVRCLLLRGEKTGRYLFTGPELTAVNLAMEVHDAQMDGCSVAEFEKAIVRAARAERYQHQRV